MIKEHKIILILLILLLVISSGCSNTLSQENTTNESQETENNSTQSSELTKESKAFLENFSQDYPEFTLLDYTVGFDDNKPIILVAVAENKETGSSSTLFIVDSKGVGQVVLASEYLATYRKEDELLLNENVISVSLDIAINDSSYKIHDFHITVSQTENDGKTNTSYSSEEIIRTN